MKNSTLLRIFFISIGLPLACSSLPPKPKTDALNLGGTSNNAPAVQLEGTVTGVPSVSEDISVSGIEDTLPKKLETSINKGEYDEATKLGDGMGRDEVLRYVYQVGTVLGQFEGLFGYSKQYGRVPGFLVREEMVVVRKVIVEANLLKTNGSGHCDSLYDAIALSLNENYHERVADLFKAAHERPAWRDKFGRFVEYFFDRYSPEKNSMPLKRFLTRYREEFNKNHPDTFKSVCEALVQNLKWRLGNPASQKLLIDFVGQPFLLTPVASARGFLDTVNYFNRINFIKYSYKEALEEGLKGDYLGGGEMLWNVMVKEFPNQFFGQYPTTDEARAVALKDFKPAKQDLEEEWIVNNAQNPLTVLRMRQLAEFIDKLDIIFPTVLWFIVAEYATVPTLLDTE